MVKLICNLLYNFLKYFMYTSISAASNETYGDNLMCYFCDHSEGAEKQEEDRDITCMRNFTSLEDHRRLCVGEEICTVSGYLLLSPTVGYIRVTKFRQLLYGAMELLPRYIVGAMINANPNV